MSETNYANVGALAFEEAVARKLPPRGLAWTRQLGSVFQGFWSAIADALAAFHASEAQLTEIEAFPPTSVQLLPDWEGVLGLPDPCLGANPNIAARQAAVAARLAASGGQSVPYFTALAANLGAAITITQYAPHRLGVDSCWAPLRNPSWAYVWLVTLQGQVTFNFEWGSSSCWEPLWTIASGPVVCEIQRRAPAHTQVDFSDF
jgi:uncharacterized protein YmfQ (DUF2313 family)